VTAPRAGGAGAAHGSRSCEQLAAADAQVGERRVGGDRGLEELAAQVSLRGGAIRERVDPA
jgi:hypothetical protein